MAGNYNIRKPILTDGDYDILSIDSKGTKKYVTWLDRSNGTVHQTQMYWCDNAWWGEYFLINNRRRYLTEFGKTSTIRNWKPYRAL